MLPCFHCKDMWELIVPLYSTNTSEKLGPNYILSTRDVRIGKACYGSLSLENKIVMLRLAYSLSIRTCLICLHTHVMHMYMYVYTNRSIHNIWMQLQIHLPLQVQDSVTQVATHIHVCTWTCLYRYSVRAKCLYGWLVGQALGMLHAMPTHGPVTITAVCLLLCTVATTLCTLQMVMLSELQIWLVKWI